MLGLRMPELLIILAVVVLMFGAKKVPELGEALGKGIRAFRKATEKGFEETESDATTVAKDQGQLPPGAAPTTASSGATDKTTAKKA